MREELPPMEWLRLFLTLAEHASAGQIFKERVDFLKCPTGGFNHHGILGVKVGAQIPNVFSRISAISSLPNCPEVGCQRTP